MFKLHSNLIFMDIYVGSIPFKWKEKDLRAIFEPFGDVLSVTIIINKSTRQNKGFGFVAMASEAAAQKAIAALDKSEYLGRKIQVLPATSKKETATKVNDSSITKLLRSHAKGKKKVPGWLRKEL